LLVNPLDEFIEGHGGHFFHRSKLLDDRPAGNAKQVTERFLVRMGILAGFEIQHRQAISLFCGQLMDDRVAVARQEAQSKQRFIILEWMGDIPAPAQTVSHHKSIQRVALQAFCSSHFVPQGEPARSSLNQPSGCIETVFLSTAGRLAPEKHIIRGEIS
jgi:hypothetical protein